MKNKNKAEGKIEKIEKDTDDYIQEVVDDRRERAKKIRRELDEVVDGIIKKRGDRIEEIEKRSEQDPNWFLSDEVKAILEEGKRRSGQSLEREKRAWDDVMNYFDGIRKAADIGFRETIEMFQVNSVVSGTRIEKTTRNILLNQKDIEGIGTGEIKVERVEELLTNYSIKILGLDRSSLSEGDKKILARMVWGREMIIESIIARGGEEGVEVTRGDVEKSVDFLIFGLMESLGLGFEETRERVLGLSGAMATEEGRKKMIEVVLNEGKKIDFG